jgi:hypothetical protein
MARPRSLLSSMAKGGGMRRARFLLAIGMVELAYFAGLFYRYSMTLSIIMMALAGLGIGWIMGKELHAERI